MGAVLDAQLETFERNIEHAGSLSLREVEEAIGVGLGLFDALATEVRAFNARPLGGTREQMLVEARSYHERYERLKTQLDHLDRTVNALRQKGYPVRGVEKLDAVRFRLRTILAFTPDRLEASYQSMRAGRVIPLSEIRDELRTRLHA